MKKISVLGSGWLGLPLAKELANEYSINLSTTSKGKVDSLSFLNITPFIVNIDDSLDNVEEFLNSEVLIVNIPSKNINGFTLVVEKVKASNIKRVIFISSTSVYKDTNSYVKEDDDTVLNDNDLLKIENLFSSLENIETTILRFGGLIGYDRNLVKHFQNRTLSNSKSVVNMIHRDDCITIIKNIILKDKFSGIYNCCASTHPTKEEFYNYCADISNYELPHYDNEMYHYKMVDNQKLIDTLGYKYIYDDLLKVKFDIDEQNLPKEEIKNATF